MALKFKEVNKLKFKEVNKNVESIVDNLFQDDPVELHKIKDNQEFFKKVEDKPLSMDVVSIPVFGTSVDFNAILKENLWDRTAYFVDMMCDGFAHMTVEQLKKYLAKKRKLPMNIIWLLIILMLVGVAVIVLILFLKGGGLGGIV